MAIDQLIGQLLADRYLITNQLGKGGMGAVFKAFDNNLRRNVAIKVMHPHLAEYSSIRARFDREGQAMASLDHVGIVKVFDFGQADSFPYIVMEFIPGDSLLYKLKQLRANRHWILLSEAVWLIQQVGLALDHAHQRNVLHRDIKPANIMLKTNLGQLPPYRPVVTDLGLAKLLQESGLTPPNTTLGTYAYMSPEQAQGKKVDARSDVYSLGILLYELVVGQRPFFVTNFSEAFHAHTRETPPPPRMLWPDLPVQLERVILKALAKNPDERFSNAAEMANALASTLSVASTVISAPLHFTESVTLAEQYPSTVQDEERELNPTILDSTFVITEPDTVPSPKEPKELDPTELNTTVIEPPDTMRWAEEPKELDPTEPATDQGEALDMFRINYQFVHPYLPLNDETLVQAVVSFSSRKDIDPSKIRPIPTHLCLVLDVSGSMNTPDKYPLLREAIPYLINALSDDDYLTIILFSMGSDVVLFAEPIADCRQQIDNILNRIDNSGVMFGRMTLLAPALQEAIEEIEHFRSQIPKAVNRLYILTDGDLHDSEECYTLNARLRTLEAEVNSYGFGQKFALDTIKRITEGIPGSGKVKPIFNTQEAKAVFSHIGKVAQQIVGQDAEFTFTFANDVIAGDAFGYRPDRKYFGPVDYRTKTFKVKLGTLEVDRTYTFLFEGTLLPTSESQPKNGNAPLNFLWGKKRGGPVSQIPQEIGKVSLRYRQGNRWKQVETMVTVQRTDKTWRHQRTNQQALEIYQTVDAMRSNDPAAQLQALRARLAVYEREGADPALVTLVKRAINKLERGETLTKDESRGLQAHTTASFFRPESALRDHAAIWVQRGYSPKRVKWLIDVADGFERDGLTYISKLEGIDNRLMVNIMNGRDPFAGLDAKSLEAFDAGIE